MKKKANKYLIQIGLYFLLLSVICVTLVQKYAPFLLHTTIYYCQEIIKSLNSQNLPHNSNLIFLVPVFFILLFVGIRLIATIAQLITIDRSLNHQKITYRSRRLNVLVKKLHLVDKIVIIDNKQPLALCYGLMKPKIYLSTKLLESMSPAELEVIINHEKHHLNHNDTRTILFAHIIQNTFPLLPILSDLVKNLRIEREIAADNYAASGGKRQHVAAVLKKLLLYPQPTFAYFPSLAAEDTLTARIESLFFKKKFTAKYSLKNITFSVFSIFILLGLILTPVQAIELHTETSDAIIVCVNNQQCAIQCKETLRKRQNMSPNPNKSIPYSPASVL